MAHFIFCNFSWKTADTTKSKQKREHSFFPSYPEVVWVPIITNSDITNSNLKPKETFVSKHSQDWRNFYSSRKFNFKLSISLHCAPKNFKIVRCFVNNQQNFKTWNLKQFTFKIAKFAYHIWAIRSQCKKGSQKKYLLKTLFVTNTEQKCQNSKL